MWQVWLLVGRQERDAPQSLPSEVRNAGVSRYLVPTLTTDCWNVCRSMRMVSKIQTEFRGSSRRMSRDQREGGRRSGPIVCRAATSLRVT